MYFQTGHTSREGKVVDFTLTIYGTKDMPSHYENPRTYKDFNPSQTAYDPLEVDDDEYEDVEERS